MQAFPPFSSFGIVVGPNNVVWRGRKEVGNGRRRLGRVGVEAKSIDPKRERKKEREKRPTT